MVLSTANKCLPRFAPLLLLLTLCTPVQAQDGDFSAEALQKLPETNWPTNGGNLYNQRYSPLTTINRTNVARLKGVWRTRLRG